MSNIDSNELELLKEAINKAEQFKGKIKMRSPNIKKILSILEKFIINKKLICYGGTAINNILPKKDQFYNKDIELPDYDVFSPNALDNIKEIADIFSNNGYTEIEAKSGMHVGTYKLYINFLPILDLTQLNEVIYNNIKKDSLKVNNILYAPPNFLRMSMYGELSKPFGDNSRWEKVLKRLIVLNKNYPIKLSCKSNNLFRHPNLNIDENIFTIINNYIIKKKLVFFGGYATSLYRKYMPDRIKNKLNSHPIMDVLSKNILSTINDIKNLLKSHKINIIKHNGIDDLINEHYEIKVNNVTVLFLYSPLACHSYNSIKYKNKVVRIASIDTMFSFYLLFIYLGREYFDVNRILCMVKYLFMLQNKNRLKNKGLLRRFNLSCYGDQEEIEDIKSKKAEMYKKLKNNKRSIEYKKWFLKYVPKTKKTKSKTKSNTKSKSKKTNKNTKTKSNTKLKSKKTNKNTKTRSNTKLKIMTKPNKNTKTKSNTKMKIMTKPNTIKPNTLNNK